MQVLEAAVAANPWPLRRERAAELVGRYPHAAEMLRLYQALTVVQESAYGIPSLENIAASAAEHVLPGVIDVTVELGPRALREGVIALCASANMEDMIQRWLDQQPLNPFETYLARASASPLLEVVTPHPDPPPRGGREFETEGSRTRCPNCGGLPQLSY